MIINTFIYTTDEQTAIDKTKEILSLLEIKDIVSISSELYWKFSDMYKAVVQSQSSLKRECLQSIADICEDYSDDILTSDTITGNVIRLENIAMIDIWY